MGCMKLQAFSGRISLAILVLAAILTFCGNVFAVCELSPGTGETTVFIGSSPAGTLAAVEPNDFGLTATAKNTYEQNGEGLGDYTMFALDGYGTSGRIGFFTDSTGGINQPILKPVLEEHFILLRWLGKTDQPRILRIGNAEYGCDVGNYIEDKYNSANNATVDVSENDFPAEYRDGAGYDLEALTQDYDIILFCAYKNADFDFSTKPKFYNAIKDFSKGWGKGVLLVGDYYNKNCTQESCTEGLSQQDLGNLNLIANDAGANFGSTKIDTTAIEGRLSLQGNIICDCGNPCDGVCLGAACADEDPDCSGEPCCVVANKDPYGWGIEYENVSWKGNLIVYSDYRNFSNAPSLFSPVCTGGSAYEEGTFYCNDSENEGEGRCFFTCNEYLWSSQENIRPVLKDGEENVYCTSRLRALVSRPCNYDGVCDSAGGENFESCPGDCCSTVCDGVCEHKNCYSRDPDCWFGGVESGGCCAITNENPTTTNIGESATISFDYERFDSLPSIYTINCTGGADYVEGSLNCTGPDASGKGSCSFECEKYQWNSGQDVSLIIEDYDGYSSCGGGLRVNVSTPCNYNYVCDPGETIENCKQDCCSRECDNSCQGEECYAIDPDCGLGGTLNGACCWVTNEGWRYAPVTGWKLYSESELYDDLPYRIVYSPAKVGENWAMEFDYLYFDAAPSDHPPKIESVTCTSNAEYLEGSLSCQQNNSDGGECTLNCGPYASYVDSGKAIGLNLDNKGQSVRCMTTQRLSPAKCNNDGSCNKDSSPEENPIVEETYEFCPEDCCPEACDGVCTGGIHCAGIDPDCKADGTAGRACCRNGVLELANAEECDYSDFGSITGCEDLGLGNGELKCYEDLCILNTSSCDKGCGNGVIDAGVGEECEESISFTEDCSSLGLGVGSVECDPYTCKYDTSDCENGCGNGVLDVGEECDYAMTLHGCTGVCKSDCTCSNNCGDGVCNLGENIGNCAQDCCIADCTGDLGGGVSDSICHNECSGINGCGTVYSVCDSVDVDSKRCLDEERLATCCSDSLGLEYCQETETCEFSICVERGMPKSGAGDIFSLIIPQTLPPITENTNNEVEVEIKVLNGLDTPTDAEGRISILDAITNTVLASHEFEADDIPPKGSKTVDGTIYSVTDSSIFTKGKNYTIKFEVYPGVQPASRGGGPETIISNNTETRVITVLKDVQAVAVPGLPVQMVAIVALVVLAIIMRK